MRLIISLGIVVALMLTACGPSQHRSDRFPLADRDATMNAFMESVRAYYDARGGGKLSDPSVNPDGIRYLFRYDKIMGGQYAEEIRLSLYDAQKTRQNDGTYKKEPAHYQVGVWYPTEGADPEAIEPRAAIVDGMKSRLAPKP